MFILSRWALKLCAAALCAAPLLLSTVRAEAPPPTIKLALIEGLSGPNANAGEAVFRNIVWAVERVNARGGVKLSAAAGGNQLLALQAQQLSALTAVVVANGRAQALEAADHAAAKADAKARFAKFMGASPQP